MKLTTAKSLNVVGGYLLFLGILSFLNTGLLNQTFTPWFCYFGALLLGYGALKKDPNIIQAQLNILTIPLLIWNIDFFYNLFTSKEIFGVTDYFFTGRNLLSWFVSIQHLYLIPIAILLLFLIRKRPDQRSIKISSYQIFIIFLLSTITSAQYNINCVHESCLSFIYLPPPLYQLMWVVTLVVISLIIDILSKKIYIRYFNKH